VKASISAQAEIRTAQVKQLLMQAEQNLAIDVQINNFTKNLGGLAPNIFMKAYISQLQAA
jgi:hypothetical protein